MLIVGWVLTIIGGAGYLVAYYTPEKNFGFRLPMMLMVGVGVGILALKGVDVFAY